MTDIFASFPLVGRLPSFGLPMRRAVQGVAIATAVLLAGCGSSPKDTISLANQKTPSSASSGVSAGTPGDAGSVSVKWSRTKPGCTGQCPTIDIDSVAFPGEPKLTELVDHVLAFMTGVDRQQNLPYDTVAGYVDYFWQTAQTRDATSLRGKVRASTGNLIVVELGTTQTLTGAAHGIPATQFLNWDRARDRVVALDEALLPDRRAAFVEAMRTAHTRWKQTLDDAKRDPASFNRMWPFQETDNFALTPDGMVLKYDAYVIAPYAAGQPELTIPYSALQGILRPEWMPK